MCVSNWFRPGLRSSRRTGRNLRRWPAARVLGLCHARRGGRPAALGRRSSRRTGRNLRCWPAAHVLGLRRARQPADCVLDFVKHRHPVLMQAGEQQPVSLVCCRLGVTSDGGVWNAGQGAENSCWEVGVAQGAVKHAAEVWVAWVDARHRFWYL